MGQRIPRKILSPNRRFVLESLESRRMLHATGMLSGSVFLDLDGNGVRGGSELGVPGVVVSLSQTGTSVSSTDRSMITDDNGRFAFDELDPGTYQISKRQTE
ncbi:MAG: carboxypeptidase regulatory-like domain-containing protein, partial [Planctomycetota bacterium]|nr:carboxypeptidase regulatory-like domain-containing protein [Planctomycetota bacterium]